AGSAGERRAGLGHWRGGITGAERACVATRSLATRALLAPAGLWIDSLPIPDLFSMLPFELVAVLFADPKNGEKFLTGGIDFTNMDALTQFLVGNARRLGTAGKILFPIPDRRLSKRLYRLAAPTLLVLGNQDTLI